MLIIVSVILLFSGCDKGDPVTPTLNSLIGTKWEQIYYKDYSIGGYLSGYEELHFINEMYVKTDNYAHCNSIDYEFFDTIIAYAYYTLMLLF